MNDLYSDDLLAELEKLQHVGEVVDADLVVSGVNASCGDEVSFSFKLEKKKGLHFIKVAKWQGKGCSISQVSCSVFAQKIQGFSLEEVAGIEQADMEKSLGIQSISLGRVKCLLLPLQVVQKQTVHLRKNKEQRG